MNTSAIHTALDTTIEALHAYAFDLEAAEYEAMQNDQDLDALATQADLGFDIGQAINILTLWRDSMSTKHNATV